MKLFCQRRRRIPPRIPTLPGVPVQLPRSIHRAPEERLIEFAVQGPADLLSKDLRGGPHSYD